MFDAHRRPWGRLFYLLAIVLALPGALWSQTPATTTVSDFVYRADGSLAGGLLISWPTFSTAGGQIVAAGRKSVTLGPGGTLSVALVPNTSAVPADTFYTVVYQLDDGTVKTEFWVVTPTSPTTISAIRTVIGSGSSSIISVGNGSFVRKTGDTMTGPLQLPGNPVAPNQVSTKQYVDNGLAVKADVVGGVVPSGQLGNGTANNGFCLHGDSSWGACGASGNAVSIQNVPVDSTAPIDNQVSTYVASLGKYEPRAGSGITAGMAATKYSSDFNWSQSPSTNLSAPGAKTVNLAACVAGVLASEPQYYVYVAGTGTAEAVLVTGGSCQGDGQPGTLQFTTANAHPAGYTVGSASSGIQEAVIGARFTPTNPTGTSQSGKVVVPPGEFKAFARISIRASNLTVDFSGSIVECWMVDTCIFVGDPSVSNAYHDITLISPRGRPTIVNGQRPFIEVNAQKTRLINVSTRVNLGGGTFSSYVQVDDDESFLLDGLDTVLGSGSGNAGVRCDATVCNPIIYAPGPYGAFPGVGWLKNLNISLQCQANGIDWQAGNTLRISDSVVQSFAQYGVRAGTKRGGFGGFELANVYEEVGECGNPAGPIGQAGVIAQGTTVKIQGGLSPNGLFPQFANTGTATYHYYVVANHATNGPSNPLYGNPAHIGISFGAPQSISNYIANVGDGTSWLERLTSTLKEFKTDVQMDGTLTVTGVVQAGSFVFTQTPTQCAGSFATGIQSNGNANCSTADVIQIAETAPPTGVANHGLFWFDSTCHCPKVISNNGQSISLGLLNVFSSDANTLEEYNGTNPQTLRMYGTRTDASNYERVGFKWDNADGYFALASENAGTGSQCGIAFWIGNNVRWAIDTASTLKPFADNSYNVGSTSLRTKTFYAGTSFDITNSGALTFEPCNDGTTGTSLNFLAKYNGASSPCVIKAATTDVDGIVGIVSGGSGTTGSATVVYRGYAQCSFDGSTTGGDYVIASTTNAADCHDAGAARPAGAQVIGRALTTNSGAGTYLIFASLEPPSSGSASAVPWFTQPSASGSVAFLTTTNVAKLYGVLYSSATPLATTQVTYNVQTADNTANTYDIGLYSSSGALLAHVGSTAGTTFAPSAGWKTLSWTSASTIKQGKYYLAITTSCTSSCAALIGSSTGVGFTFAGAVQESVTAGGTLPSTITIPSDAYTATTIPTWSIQ